MAAGRTSRPRSGLCVVINGNLKQRELTISFFISSPMLRAQERPRRTRSPSRMLRTHTDTVVQTHVHARTHRGAPLAPRGVDLSEGGKREEDQARSERIGCWSTEPQGWKRGMVVVALSSGYTQAKKP